MMMIMIMMMTKYSFVHTLMSQMKVDVCVAVESHKDIWKKYVTAVQGFVSN